MRMDLLHLGLLLGHVHLAQQLEIKKIQAVEGGEAALPCDFHHPAEDSVFLILWFNGNLTTPIYNYDLRPGTRGSHWVDETVLGSRARLDVTTNPARLNLTNVRLADAGLYKCRVDFRSQPTKTTRVNLEVIVPPKKVWVTSSGRVVKSVVGPYREGDTADLTCVSLGGSPPPRVMWFLGGQLIDSQMDDDPQANMLRPGLTNALLQGPSTPPTQQNTLHLGPFTRSDLKKLVTCEVSNTNMTAPLTAAVMIDMNLSPLGVSLLGPGEPLSYGLQYDLVCEVRGSRPPPTITWWRGATRVQGARETTTSDGNMTSSTLSLAPRPPDDGTTVTCRAENPATNTVLEQSLPLKVYYVPEAVARLGLSLVPQSIKEGDDVYFECSIQANPRIYKLTWQHNGRLLQHNITAGVIVSNQSLVLQRVTRRHGGRYTCSASNIEGDGVSEPINLDIKYSPVCAPGQVTTYGVARHEDAEVTCRVAANPPAEKFKWTFNNTADTIDVPHGRFTSAPTFSIITYTPMTELDYGTLLCWATNVIGKQTRPCLFHIVPAGKPDPPANCSVHNQTSTGFSVSCQAGFDGGLRQVFLLRVARPGTQGHNLTAGHPVFQVGQLEPDTTYRLQVWAANDKGVSPSVHLRAFTTHPSTHQHTAHVVAEVREGSSGSDGSETGSANTVGNTGSGSDNSVLVEEEQVAGVPALVSVVVGASVGIVLLLLLLGLLVRQRVRRPPAPPPASHPTHTLPPTTHSPTTLPPTTSPPPILKSSHDQASHPCAHRDMQVESETEVDPDLIPQQLVHSTLTPSGPLLRPPVNYRGAEPPFCQVVVAGGGAGRDGGGGDGGAGGGAGAVHHQLLSTTYTSPHHHHHHHHQPATAATSSSTPHHHSHQHSLPQQQQQQQQQQHYQHLVTDDPRYAHLDLEAGGRQVSSAGQRSRAVPTVYATLDTRHTHSRVTFDIRHSHSQASLDRSRGHDLAYSDESRLDQTYHHHHDAARPLLADDPSPDTASMVSKRESSV